MKSRSVLFSFYWLFIVFFLSCCSESNESRIVDVYKLTDSVYIEDYCCYGGGVFGGDIINSYITDSVSFRKYVGEYDDNSVIYYKFFSNSVIKAYKVIDIGIWKHQYDTVLLQAYELSSLKKEHSFDVPCEN
ncbi:MAG: hypothetical protein IKO89_05520 [Bacteroidales bacterium]|nr:hypothetical protein [Bacteroidales bacterium]